MNKLFYIDISNKCLSCGWALALLYCLAACTDEKQPEDSGENMPGTVNIVIGPTDDANTRTITGDEIHSLRIYAFPSGTDKEVTAVGYVEDTDPTGSGPYRYTMDLSKRGKLDFIALINDGDAKTENNPSITLDENTTLSKLLDYRFSGLTDVAVGLPMSTLEGTDGSNRTFNVAGTSASQTIHLDATRAMARLQLYFAKYNTGIDQVTIDEAILTGGPSATRLAVQESSESDLDINVTERTIITAPVSVDKVLTSTNEKLTDANTTLVAKAYILENPFGATGTNTDQELDGTAGTGDVTDKAYKLTVNYSVGTNNPISKTFYLPAVERNQTIRVFGLLEGKDLRLFIRVAKWKVEDVELVDYPTYTDSQPLENNTSYSTTARYVDTNNQNVKEENAFGVTFAMTAPEGQQFTPALVNNGNFELKVYNSAGTDVTDNPDAIVGSAKYEYTIYVIPTAPYDTADPANNQTELIITTTTWAGANDLLLINRNKNWNSDDNPEEDRIRITIEQ